MDTWTRISDLLNKNRKTDAEFAASIGVKPDTITNWRTGKAKSYSKYIDKIADYLGVSTDYLLCKTDERLPLSSLMAHEVGLDNKKILIDAKTDKEQKILHELEDLDDNDLNMIRAMITAYKTQKKQE